MKGRLSGIRKYAAHILLVFMLISVILTSYSMYKNKQQKISDLQNELNIIRKQSFAMPDALTNPVLQNMNIRISDLTREDIRIRNRTFDNCHIYGPAVIVPNNVIFEHVVFVEITYEGRLIETTNTEISGAIGLENCVLRNCVLHKITIIGSPEVIKKLKEEIPVQ